MYIYLEKCHHIENYLKLPSSKSYDRIEFFFQMDIKISESCKTPIRN